jgi:hypothetical protein
MVMVNLNGPEMVGVIICVGVAAFGIVDAARSFFPGINRMGFVHIRKMVASLTPEMTGAPLNTLTQAAILESLKANWASGVELNSQKTTAKLLVMMHLSPRTAAAVAARTNFDSAVLTEIAASITSGAELTKAQVDINARFDLIVSALLDEAYRNSDRVYRNGVHSLAALVAVITAFCIGWGFTGISMNYYLSTTMDQYLLLGLVATPLPPIAKDVSQAVSSAVKKKIQSYL